ncbi:mitochondrial ribosomal protein L23 [Oratosquilla oratoria]|uniref:mitochondrial ribosomal protein L23 n=1 Tax=Oratosquilla oratoria TaxID=337810 RepID=UPI003F75955B
MSTRWYPLYQRGNPQLRVFLPNFIMKLVKPRYSQPPNVVQFECSMQMSKFDVKNYLEQIYNVPVAAVHTRIHMGKFKRNAVRGYVVKDDDYKIAYVTLAGDQTFEFPDLFPEEKQKEQDKQLEQLDTLKKEWNKSVGKNAHRKDVPSWFGI